MSVRKNLAIIIDAFHMVPSSSEILRSKFIESGWISFHQHPTEEELVILALGRIEMDTLQFQKFVTMLRDIKGMEPVVQQLTGTVFS